MRELKFRAWNEEDHEMTYMTDLYWFEENGVHDFDGQGHYRKYAFQQFTGLLDKNGKEVFEGDIVKRWHSKPSKVYWDGFNACWRMTGFTGVTKGDMALMCEVIGNIYESPALLRQVNRYYNLQES